MPEIKKSGISGCCVGSYFYDLGGAHSKYRSKNVEEFALKMLELGMSRVNIAMTNSAQGPERQFLEQLNFREVFATQVGGMHVHAVEAGELERALAPYKEILLQRQREAEEKRRKAEEERLAKAKAAEETRRKKEEEAFAKLVSNTKTITDNTPVTIDWVRAEYAKYPSINVGTIFNTLFGFKGIPTGYIRTYDDLALLKSINSRLARRALMEKEKAKK